MRCWCCSVGNATDRLIGIRLYIPIVLIMWRIGRRISNDDDDYGWVVREGDLSKPTTRLTGSIIEYTSPNPRLYQPVVRLRHYYHPSRQIPITTNRSATCVIAIVVPLQSIPPLYIY